MRPPVKALPGLALAACLLASPRSSRAEDGAIYTQFGVGATGVYGELGQSFDSELTRSLLGLGMRWKRLALSVDLLFDFRASGAPELHSSNLFGFEVGPELRYFFPLGGGGNELYLRGGVHRVSWSGSSEVRRSCEQTGTCAGGFYGETPSYDGLSLRSGIGVHKTLPKTAGSSLHMGFFADLGLEQTRLDLIGDSVGGTIISASIGIEIGGSRSDS